MRIKQIIVASMAVFMLAGCGDNTTNESMNTRGWDQIENVRNQPRQQGLDDRGMNQYPGDDRRMNNRNMQTQRFDETAQDLPSRFMEDGRINEERQKSRRDYMDSQQSGDRSDNRQGDRQNRSNQTDQYNVSEQLAEDINAEVDGIDGAYVLTMGDNAYVACHLDNDQASNRDGDLSDNIKQEVTEAAKDSDNKINNVYVSSNPDFVDLTSNYMRDIDRGEPIEGFVDQFTEMIERVFPTQNR